MGLTRTPVFARSVADPTSRLCATGYTGDNSSDPVVTGGGRVVPAVGASTAQARQDRPRPRTCRRRRRRSRPRPRSGSVRGWPGGIHGVAPPEESTTALGGLLGSPEQRDVRRGWAVRPTRRVRTELGESTGTFRELFITRGILLSVDVALHPQTGRPGPGSAADTGVAGCAGGAV